MDQLPVSTLSPGEPPEPQGSDGNTENRTHGERAPSRAPSLLGTSFLDEDPEQRVCTRDGLAEVVIVVDGQQVTMHVRVPDGHLGVGDVVGVYDQLVEVFKLPRLLSV